MKKITVLLISAVFMFSAASLFADNIGAGLGRLALGDGKRNMKGAEGKLWNLLGVTLNDFIFANQSFAISSGTSGYQKGATIGYDSAVHEFVAFNMDPLAADMAKGSGEYLDTLGTIMNVEDRASFNAKMQENFLSIYTSYGVSAEQVAENIIRVSEM